MSGYPTGLEASPHGDALLRPGKDSEIMVGGNTTLPNRTGGGIMNVREALGKLLENCDMVNPRLDAADELAPIIEKALRAAYSAGFTDGKAVYEWISDANAPGGCPRCRTELTTTTHLNSEQRERCGVTAGINAMMEEE